MKTSGAPEILFGPYGSRLQAMEETHGQNGISEPAAILNGPGFRQAVKDVAIEHLLAGGDVGTTHTFGLRGLIHKPGENGTFREALCTHHRVLRAAQRETGRRVREAISFGPAYDCYTPNPGFGIREAADFHGIQAHEAGVLQADAAWFETVNTAAEGAGIAVAAKHHKVPCVISFVLNREGKLLSGESVADAILEADSVSGKHPVGYSFNCCPIEALEPALKACGKVLERVIAVYPNSSSKDPKTLETSTGPVGMVDSDQTALYLHFLAKKYRLKIVGGCCGYDHRDVGRISQAVRQGLHRAELPPTDLLAA